MERGWGGCVEEKRNLKGLGIDISPPPRKGKRKETRGGGGRGTGRGAFKSINREKSQILRTAVEGQLSILK